MQGPTAFNEVPTQTKDTQIVTISAVHFSGKLAFQHMFTGRDQPDIQQAHGEREARQAQEMTQTRPFQVKAIAFHGMRSEGWREEILMV